MYAFAATSSLELVFSNKCYVIVIIGQTITLFTDELTSNNSSTILQCYKLTIDKIQWYEM